MRSLRLAAILTLVAGGCGERNTLALGDANSVIVVAQDSIWSEVAEPMRTALEPEIFTVRNERTFKLTHVSPMNEDWLTLREFRQLVLVGEETDPWVVAALESSDRSVPDAPALVEREDVWARGQVVTIMLLPPGGGASLVVELLPELHELLDARFRNYVLGRQFASGRNDSLRAALEEEAGFGLLVPNVYRWRQVADSAYMFINDYPTAEQLVRSILVTWRTGEDVPSTGDILAWRRQVADHFYDWGQATEADDVRTESLDAYDGRAAEVRGVWTGRIEGFPQAGPFITRTIVCPDQDRTYLVDAWLYAPGKDKYEYVLQLQTILGSFQCGG